MNLRPVVVVLLLALVILAGIPESSAEPQYLTILSTVYGDGSCGTCHVRASGGGARNSYGTLFENQPNYDNDPVAALKVMGAPPTAIPTLTPIATSTPATTATPTLTSAVTIVSAKGTPAAPGFGIVVSLVGLFALALLVKRNNR